MSKAFLLVLTLTAAVNTGMAIVIPIMPIFLKDFGFTAIGLSLPFLMLAIGRFSSMLSAGYVIRRLSNKKTLITAFALFTSAFIFYPLVDSKTLLILLRLIEGASEGIAIICLTNMAIELSTKNRGKLMGYFSAAFGLGFLIGPTIGSVVHGYYGIEMMFWASAFIGLLGLLISFILPSMDNNTYTIRSRLSDKLQDNIRLFQYYLPNVVRRVSYIGLIILLPLYLVEHIGISIQQIALFFVLSAILTTILMPVVGRLTDHYSAKNIILFSLLSMALLFTGFGLTTNIAIFSLLFILETLAFVFMLPASMKLFADIVEQHPKREGILGSYAAVTEVIVIISAVAFPLLYIFNATLAWAILGLLCAVSAIPMLTAVPSSYIEFNAEGEITKNI